MASTTVHEWLKPVYEDTPVEIYVDFEPVFIGTAEDARSCRFLYRQVEEVYISIDGTKLIVSVTQERNSKKK